MTTIGLSTKEDEFYNWVQNVLALNITKTALHKHVIKKWKKGLSRCGIKSYDDLTRFLNEVEDGNVTLIKSDKSLNWVCQHNHAICMRIVNFLMNARQNKSFRLNCRTLLGRKCVKEEEVESDMAIVLRSITGTSKIAPKPDKTKPLDSLNKIWCIANMFMKSESFKNDICNTCPADTDAAMFFRMMKNCKMFDLDGDEDLYQEVIDIRNKLHHSSAMLIKKQESKGNLDTLKKLLGLFSIDECRKALSEIDEVNQHTHYLGNIRKAIFLKSFALETDRKIEEGNGYYFEETRELQIEALEHCKYTSLEQFSTIKSKEDLKRENDNYQQQFLNLTTGYTYTEMDDLQEELKGRTQKLETKYENNRVFDKLLADTRHLRCELANLSQKRYKVTNKTKVHSSRDENMQIIEKLREEIKETRKQISDLRVERNKKKTETTNPEGQHAVADKSVTEKENCITVDLDDVELFKDKSSIKPTRQGSARSDLGESAKWL